MTADLTTQPAIVVVRLVGKVLGGLGQLLAVMFAALAETLVDAATATFEQILRAGGGAIGVVARTFSRTVGGITDLAFDITMAHGVLLGSDVTGCQRRRERCVNS
jgi:hypothetical protein